MITHSPRTPFSAHAFTASSTAAAGTAMIARSTGSGMARTSGKHLMECTTSAFGLTG